MRVLKIDDVISFIRQKYPDKELIHLHEPVFMGNEKKYILDAIDSTFVSSVGEYVNRFEAMMASITGSKYAVATMNGTAALHISLVLAGVKRGDEVLTQALTFIATANAISYEGGVPVFIDIDTDTLGMSPIALEDFLNERVEIKNGQAFNRKTGKRIAACVPMHVFGHPCKIDQIAEICTKWNIPLIEDAAESIGSFYKGKHTGSYGLIGTFSFNGNKTVTCGGGGAIVTNDEQLAKLAKHLTTQAKTPHRWEFNHDMVGYNYRLPNLNAAMACAQLEMLDEFVADKRDLANQYSQLFRDTDIRFIDEPKDAKSNFWLCAILMQNSNQRDIFLAKTNDSGIMTRPVWTLMSELPMFKDCETDSLKNSKYIADRLVNLPSGVRLKK